MMSCVWVGYCYPWGYADNHPYNSEFCQFKIDWAVDKKGIPVILDKIDFIKIYTAINQNTGWTGEISRKHKKTCTATVSHSFR